MSKPNIIVTEKEYSKAKEIFSACDFAEISSAPYFEEPLTSAVTEKNASIVFLGVDKYTGPLYDALKNSAGKNPALMARFGVGHDGVDKSIAAQHNIYVTNTPGVLDQSVAEHALWLMGDLARNISRSHENFRKGRFPSYVGTELSGKTLAVIGFGPIGRTLAKMASSGLGMKIIAVDLVPLADLAKTAGMDEQNFRETFGVTDYISEANKAFAEADIVSIHLPVNEKTKHFVNEQRLGLMKPTAMLINTSRGAMVDENALYDALSQSQIAGAALDVFETEPYVPTDSDRDLRTLENIVLCSHNGSSTYEANRRMALRCLQNAKLFLDGKYDRLDTVS